MKMADVKSNRFTKYFSLLLEALRSVHPRPMRPAEVTAWIRANYEVPADDLTRYVQNGTQSIFENDVHWVRFYLVKAGLLDNGKRGQWSLTAKGLETKLTLEQTWDLYVRIRDSNRPTDSQLEEGAVPAPGTTDEDEEDKSYWFVGAVWNGTEDQLPRFREQGVWENGYDDQFLDVVRRIRPGDQIAVKASFVKKHGLPFEVGGKSVSVMRIKATGTVLKNEGDGKSIKVAWDKPAEPRDWYFYTYRTTIVEVDVGSEDGRRLIDFTFRGAPQDYEWWLARPYWSEKYDTKLQSGPTTSPQVAHEAYEITEEEPNYGVEDILEEGCFLTKEELSKILDCWRLKKNLILQGPPGTGKTWLAKRLGYALAGSSDNETRRSRLRVVQFHPSLAYEDFVRGWRPAGEGKLELVDGILMQAIQAAASEPDRPFVLVIEEINRGNPAQIFGEMLTLLEASKRDRTEAMELAYRRKSDEEIYVPKNLYVIGTMNIADRSLAIVDLALRRRFAFVDLEPRFGPAWQEWCVQRGLNADIIAQIEIRITALNEEISKALTLGPQFRIGHSYITPDFDAQITDGRGWFRAKVETEITPLLHEYWYDAPETAKAATEKLLAGFK
jgi:5-methylcytosine-specific restriction enzyme B